MKIIVLCLAAAAYLNAAVPSNSVTISEKNGGGQPERPFSISRVFAQGDIRHYPQPVIDGTPETTWQSDVKTRWRDGRAIRTITDATNEDPITITASSHGFMSGDLVTVSGVGGNAAANGTWRIVRFSRDKFILLGSSGNGQYTSGGTVGGPDYGSVQHAIVSFTESLTSGQSKTLTFQNSENPCSSGNRAACDAAGLDESEMLAFNSSSWGASIEAETPDGNDTTRSVSARTIIDDANFEYWLRGPVVTQVIAEDRTSSRTYDFGWSCTSNCTGDYSAASWADDTTYRSIHPRFILTFYAGWSGVKVDYVLENTWISKHQDQRYAFALKSGSGLNTAEYTQPATTHYAFQRWRKTFWDGEEPGDVETDLNIEYMVYSRALPMFDVAKSVNSTDLASEISFLRGTTLAPLTGNGPYAKYFPTTGGRAEIGMFPRWFVRLLLSGFDYELWDEVMQVGDISGHIPIHYRESQSGTRYFWDADNDGTTVSDTDDNLTGNGAFGEVLSLDANPTNGVYNKIANEPGTTNSSSHGWTADTAHQSSFAYIPYLLTGDPYYLEELQFWSAWNFYGGNHATSGGSYARHKNWVIMSPARQERGTAWEFRNLVHAAWLTPDESSQKDYLRTKIDNTIAAYEAVTEVKNGLLFQKITNAPDNDPCPASGGTNDGKTYESYSGTSSLWSRKTPYCHGEEEYRTNRANPLGMPSTAVAAATTGFYYPATPYEDYVLMMVLGHAKELGFPTDGWLKAGAKLLLNMGGNDILNVYNVDSYRRPARDADNNFFTTWTEFYADYPESYTSKSAFTGAGDVSHGYIFMYLAALGYLTDMADGAILGSELYDWFSNETNIPNIRTYEQDGAYDYKWALVPRLEPVQVLAEPGDTFAILRYQAPSSGSCKIEVADNPSFTSPLVNSDDGLTTRERERLVSGLATATDYYWRITCPDDPYSSGPASGTFSTTTSLTGTASLWLIVGPGSSQVHVDHGATSGLGETVSVSCETGCTVNIPDIQEGLYYIRIRRTAELSGRVRRAIVRNH